MVSQELPPRAFKHNCELGLAVVLIFLFRIKPGREALAIMCGPCRDLGSKGTHTKR